MDSQKDEQSFSLKVQESHPIYEGVCTCKENYVGETKQNGDIRWEVHSDISKMSESSIYIKSNPTACIYTESFTDCTN